MTLVRPYGTLQQFLLRRLLSKYVPLVYIEYGNFRVIAPLDSVIHTIDAASPFEEVFLKNVYWTILDDTKSVYNAEILLDIGAHAGFATISFLSINKRGNAIMLEPNPILYLIARLNISLNGFDNRARIMNLALYDRETDLYLCVQGTLDTGQIQTYKDKQCYKVKSTTLHDLISKLARDYKNILVKIDIEGAEINILNNHRLIKFLSTHVNTMVIELHPHIYGFNNMMKLLYNIKKYFNAKIVKVNTLDIFRKSLVDYRYCRIKILCKNTSKDITKYTVAVRFAERIPHLLFQGLLSKYPCHTIIYHYYLVCSKT